MTLVRGVAIAALLVCVGGCTRGEEPPDAEPPTLDVTHWTDRSELFMEYPPLAAGETALFAVHLTRLSDFSAMTSGRTRVEFAPAAGGAPVVLQGGGLSRPGVYRVEGTLPAAGQYRWALVIEAPDLMDRHELGTVTVFADQRAAVADAESRGGEDAAAISYLKEPQWTNGFATAPAQEAEMRRGLRVPAVVRPVTGGEAIVAAPAAGRYMTGTLPGVGDRVRAGQELGRLQPRLAQEGVDRSTLSADVAAAQVSLEGARADLSRAQGLLAERAVPARRVEEAERAVRVAESRLAAAQARLSQRDQTLRSGGGGAGGNAFVLRAPIAGRLAQVYAALGAAYEEGAPLFRVVRTDRVALQVQLPAADAPLAAPIDEIALEIPGRADPIVVAPDHMHDAGVIDEDTHALPVQFDIDNRGGQLLIGQTATAVLYSAARERMVTVPRDAVLTEAGRPYVFVQLGGESFARRFVEVATRDGNRVGLRAGVKPGERVVTRGAYDVQLASAASGLPAEGHVH